MVKHVRTYACHIHGDASHQRGVRRSGQIRLPISMGTSSSTALIRRIYLTHLHAQSYGAVLPEHLRRPAQRHLPLRDRRTLSSCVSERQHAADVCPEVLVGKCVAAGRDCASVEHKRRMSASSNRIASILACTKSPTHSTFDPMLPKPHDPATYPHGAFSLPHESAHGANGYRLSLRDDVTSSSARGGHRLVKADRSLPRSAHTGVHPPAQRGRLTTHVATRGMGGATRPIAARTNRPSASPAHAASRTRYTTRGTCPRSGGDTPPSAA